MSIKYKSISTKLHVSAEKAGRNQKPDHKGNGESLQDFSKGSSALPPCGLNFQKRNNSRKQESILKMWVQCGLGPQSRYREERQTRKYLQGKKECVA